MFISPAYAQAAGGGGADFSFLIMMVLLFMVFYFLLIRPQQKKMKQHREMVSNVRRGDKIVTGGGLIGTVVKVTEGSDEVQVELAENVRVKVLRHTIADLMSKPQPAKAEGKGGKGDGKQEAANDSAPAQGGGGFSLSKLFGNKPK